MDTNLGVRLEKQQGKFCCLLSHDLDDVKSGEIIDDVVELEDDMGIRSTLFVMPSQTKFRDAIIKTPEKTPHFNAGDESGKVDKGVDR